MSSLYHREVYWKNSFDKQAFNLIKNNKITLTQHFVNHVLYDYVYRYMIDFDSLNIIIDELIEDKEIKPFEVEIENNKVTKAVVRVPYDDTSDISIVFRKNKIITAWLNKREDKHYTLDETKYKKE